MVCCLISKREKTPAITQPPDPAETPGNTGGRPSARTGYSGPFHARKPSLASPLSCESCHAIAFSGHPPTQPRLTVIMRMDGRAEAGLVESGRFHQQQGALPPRSHPTGALGGLALQGYVLCPSQLAEAAGWSCWGPLPLRDASCPSELGQWVHTHRTKSLFLGQLCSLPGQADFLSLRAASFPDASTFPALRGFLSCQPQAHHRFCARTQQPPTLQPPVPALLPQGPAPKPSPSYANSSLDLRARLTWEFT